MALTRLQMVTEALDNMSRSADGTMRSNTTLLAMGARWANRAQVETARKYDLIFKTSVSYTLASQQTYAFPESLHGLYRLILEDPASPSQARKLQCIMPWEMARVIPQPNNQVNRIPVYYMPYKSNLQFDLFPIPDKAYLLRMFAAFHPADMMTDNDISDYQNNGVDVDDVLVGLITSYGFQWLQEMVDAKYWRDYAMERLQEAWKNTRDLFPDWAPKGLGFSAKDTYVGEYYNDPFIIKEPYYGY